jgi:hypothetical protein
MCLAVSPVGASVTAFMQDECHPAAQPQSQAETPRHPLQLCCQNFQFVSFLLEAGKEAVGMTGDEAARFEIGVLPLMLSAIEHYEDVFKPFKRYRKFDPEIELYQQQLGTQKTIFRNQCHLLLATLANRQTAKDMLKEGKHPSWEDPDLNERFSRLLGDYEAAYKNTITLIQVRLKEIEEKTQSFRSVTQQSIPVRLQDPRVDKTQREL